MRIDELTIHRLYYIYEHGGDHAYESICKNLEINPTLCRIRAREIITHFINKYCEIKDNKHPILDLHPLRVRELLDMLQSEGKGAKLKLDDDAPSVF
jgi:hypothetical protein